MEMVGVTGGDRQEIHCGEVEGLKFALFYFANKDRNVWTAHKSFFSSAPHRL